MPKKIEREFLNDDLETLAITDRDGFVKHVYRAASMLADRMSAARGSRQVETDSPRQKKKRNIFYEKTDSGEFTGLIMDANEAAKELIALSFETGKHDPDHDTAVIKKAVDAAEKLENALAEADELGFDKAPSEKTESFDENAVKEKLAEMEIEIMNGSAQLKRYKSDHAKFKHAPSNFLYTNEFVRQLQEFDENIDAASAMTGDLKNDIEELNVLLKDENTGEKEINKIMLALEDKRKKFAEAIAKMEAVTPAMSKEYARKLKSYDRVFGAARKIVEFKKSPDLNRLPNGRKITNELLKKAQEIQDQQLTDTEIKDFENEVDEKIFQALEQIDAKEKAAREAEAAKIKAEKVEEANQQEMEKLSAEYRLPLRVENDQIKKMSDELKPLIKFAEYAGSSSGADLNIDPKDIALVKSVERNIWQAGLSNADLSEAFAGQSKMPLAEMRKRIAGYNAEYNAAKNDFDEAMKIIDAIRTKVVHNLRTEFFAARLPKEHITDREESILLGLEAILKNTKELTWRDIEDVKFILKKNVLAPMGEAIKKSMETPLNTRPDLVEPKAEKSAEELLAGAFPKEELTPYKPAEEIKLTRKEIIAEIGEMYKNEGVINLNSREILDVLQPKDIEAMIEHLRADAMAKSDGNSGEFKRILRESLNKDLLKSLNGETRDKIGEAVIEQTYALLKGAVDAESRAEILRLQTTKAEKLARLGAVGANIVARIGLGVGLGIVSAPAVAATGGLASAVVGAAFAGLNKGIDRLSDTALVKKAKSSIFGKLFGRNKPAIDEAKVIENTAKATITPEMLANILSGQLRENTSEELRYRIETFSQLKKSAERSLSPDAIEKFESSLDDVSKDFYKNSFDYLSLKYAGQNLPPEQIAVMARLMTADINVNQKNEMKTAESAEKKPAAVKVMEKITKIKSHSVGAFFYGGGMSLAIAEGPAVARVVGGALSGAGLGLMIEGRMRASSDKKIIDKTKELLPAWENISRKSGGELLSKDWTNYQNDIALMRKNLAEGKFDKDPLIKIRVENLSARFERMMLERGKVGKKLITEIAADLDKQLNEYNIVAKKHEKSLMKIFGIKDRRTIFVLAGAVVGSGFGYIMSQGGWNKIMSLFDSETPTTHPVVINKHDLNVMPHTVHETMAPPATPLKPLPPETPLQPINETPSVAPQHAAHHAPTHQVPHAHAASHLEKVVTPPVEDSIAAEKSPIPENPYVNNSGDDLIEEELKKVKISHEVDTDIFDHFDRSAHPRLSDENYQRMLKIYSESGSDKARDYLDSIEHGRGHADKLESIKHKFGSRVDETVSRQAEQIKNQMSELPSATNRVMSESPIDRGAVDAAGVDDVDAGAPDAGLSPENQKFVDEAQRRIEAGRIFDENSRQIAHELGPKVEQGYNWLQQRMEELNDDIISSRDDVQVLKLSEDLDRLKELNSELKLDMFNRDGKVSQKILDQINREMTTHGI